MARSRGDTLVDSPAPIGMDHWLRQLFDPERDVQNGLRVLRKVGLPDLAVVVDWPWDIAEGQLDRITVITVGDLALGRFGMDVHTTNKWDRPVCSVQCDSLEISAPEGRSPTVIVNRGMGSQGSIAYGTVDHLVAESLAEERDEFTVLTSMAVAQGGAVYDPTRGGLALERFERTAYHHPRIDEAVIDRVLHAAYNRLA